MKIKKILPILLVIIGCVTTPKPNNKVPSGNAIGFITLKTTRTYWSLPEGKYSNNLLVVAENVKTKKKYTAKSKDGNYLFYNLPVGEYNLWKWRYSIRANKSITIYLTSDFQNISFNILPNSITTLPSINVYAEIPKDFSYKVNYTILKKSVPNNFFIDYFTSIDTENYYKEYEWITPNLDLEQEFLMPIQEISENYKKLSDIDAVSIDDLYAENEFFLAFMLFHRMLENSLKAVYTNSLGIEFESEIKDLRKIAELSKITLTPDEQILLFDISSYQKKIERQEIDSADSLFISPGYFNSYYKKVMNLRNNIISNLN